MRDDDKTDEPDYPQEREAMDRARWMLSLDSSQRDYDDDRQHDDDDRYDDDDDDDCPYCRDIHVMAIRRIVRAMTVCTLVLTLLVGLLIMNLMVVFLR